MLSHFGIFVEDLDTMVAFYTQVFGLRLTDQGVGANFRYQLRFLSGSPTQHHQLLLASGKVPGTPSSVMQISFKVDDLDDLRAVRSLALQRGASQMRGMNHGNALSLYFSDPEGNTIEVYLDTPWYVPQPHGDILDLDQSDEKIWAETERICRDDPGFMTVSQWRNQFTVDCGKQRLEASADVPLAARSP